MSRPPKVGPAPDDGSHIVGPVHPGPGAPETLTPPTITAAWVQLATALGQGLPTGINRARAASRRLTRTVR